MRALVLCAGEGTRLRPLTLDRPKAMVEIAGVPLVVHILTWLGGFGIREVAINLHHLPDAIPDALGNGAQIGLDITYSYEETLLGTAGAARKLHDWLSDPFLVVYGDNLLDVDLGSLIESHRSLNALATIGLARAENPTRVGVVLRSPDGRVTRFIEKPPAAEILQLQDEDGSFWANAGVYILNRSVLDAVPPGTPWDFGFNVFPDLLSQGLPLYAFPLEGYLLDIGSLERLAQAEADARAGRVSLPPINPNLRVLSDLCVETRGVGR